MIHIIHFLDISIAQDKKMVQENYFGLDGLFAMEMKLSYNIVENLLDGKVQVVVAEQINVY